MNQDQGGTAVITGAASGFGLEASRIAASRGMNVVMADVQADALESAVAEIRALGAKRCSISAGRVCVSVAKRSALRSMAASNSGREARAASVCAALARASLALARPASRRACTTS